MVKHWIEAFRLRTLPLSLACVGMGGALSVWYNSFDSTIFSWVCITTIFLQVLSNLANDYGDSENGADHAERQGPSRATQTGKISMSAMKKAIVVFVLLSLFSGVYLLWLTFGMDLTFVLPFLLLGMLAIAAAIKYTMGKNPYGYAGLGDISVFLFFGLVGVMGTFYLLTQQFYWETILPAISVGLLSTGVLNVNNIRDIASDQQAGKYSIPVRLGKEKAVFYHWALLLSAMLTMVGFAVLQGFAIPQYLFVFAFPLLVKNGLLVQRGTQPQEIDPGLKQLSLSTLLFVILFFVSVLV